MKLICIDNYGRESVADKLIAENLSEYWGYRIAGLLNDNVQPNGDEYFRCVEDNHVLWRGMEELV